jgi:hypothetical protein
MGSGDEGTGSDTLTSTGVTTLDWATFGVAAASAFAALAAVFYTARTHRRSIDQQRRAQASQVAIWVESATYDMKSDPPRWSDFEVVVYNASDSPIHDVRIDRLPVDWSPESEHVEAASVSVVLPRTEAPWIPFAGFVGEVPVVDGIPQGPPLRVRFVDNAGVSWVRYPNGRLEEAKDRPAWRSP